MTMKKTISLLLALVMCLSLCACGSTSNPTVETNAPTETTQSPTEPNNTVVVGEKYAGENLEIIVNSVEFADLLGKDNTTRVFERDESWNSPGDGKVYMIVKFDYTSLAKQDTDMTRDIELTVVYKDGYEFASFEEDEAYIFEDDINGVFRQCILDSGYKMTLSPLTNGSYFIAIPVAEMVSTDSSSSIQIKIEYGPNIKGGASVAETIWINVQ